MTAKTSTNRARNTDSVSAFRKTLTLITDHLLILGFLTVLALAAFQQAYETKYGLEDGAWPDSVSPASSTTAPVTTGSAR